MASFTIYRAGHSSIHIEAAELRTDHTDPTIVVFYDAESAVIGAVHLGPGDIVAPDVNKG